MNSEKPYVMKNNGSLGNWTNKFNKRMPKSLSNSWKYRNWKRRLEKHRDRSILRNKMKSKKLVRGSITRNKVLIIGVKAIHQPSLLQITYKSLSGRTKIHYLSLFFIIYPFLMKPQKKSILSIQRSKNSSSKYKF